MTADDDRSRPGGRRRVTMRDLAASYRPRSAGDLLFMHGLARIAARQTLRAGRPLYVPPDWQNEDAGKRRD